MRPAETLGEREAFRGGNGLKEQLHLTGRLAIHSGGTPFSRWCQFQEQDSAVVPGGICLNQAAFLDRGQDAANVSSIHGQGAAKISGSDAWSLRQFIENTRFGEGEVAIEVSAAQQSEPHGVVAVEGPHCIHLPLQGMSLGRRVHKLVLPYSCQKQLYLNVKNIMLGGVAMNCYERTRESPTRRCLPDSVEAMRVLVARQ
jgi:hypothetical protein